MNFRYHLSGFTRWAKLVREHGRPHALFHFNGGIGDQLLCTAVAREIQRRQPRNLWFFTQSPELFVGNTDFRLVLPLDLTLVPWARLSGTRVQRLFYQDLIEGEGRDAPLHEPSIAALCRRAGVGGEVVLRPYLPQVTPAPLPRRARPRIAIHSSCLTARYAIANKQWPVENMQSVAADLATWADLIQLGSPADPALPGAVDRRGGTLVAAAQELAQCDLFVGLVGFLMHLARTVECPSVIVYGGREPPEITGYSCNTNLANRPACAPCWYYSRCDYERRCLTAITPEMVLTAVRAQLNAPPPRPLVADRFLIQAA